MRHTFRHFRQSEAENRFLHQLEMFKKDDASEVHLQKELSDTTKKEKTDKVDQGKKEKGIEKGEKESGKDKMVSDKINALEKKAETDLAAQRKKLDETDARNKAISGRADFVNSVTTAALFPGKIDTSTTTVQRPNASQAELVASASVEKPAESAAKQAKTEVEQKQTAALEQPKTSAPGSEGGTKGAAA